MINKENRKIRHTLTKYYYQGRIVDKLKRGQVLTLKMLRENPQYLYVGNFGISMSLLNRPVHPSKDNYTIYHFIMKDIVPSVYGYLVKMSADTPIGYSILVRSKRHNKRITSVYEFEELMNWLNAAYHLFTTFNHEWCDFMVTQFFKVYDRIIDNKSSLNQMEE